MLLTIKLGKKFTSLNLEKIISDYWNLSFEAIKINFDLSELQWIAIEQMNFFISWVNELNDEGRKVTVQLPSATNISPQSGEYKKRQRCINHLLTDWGILDIFDTKVEIIRGDIKPTRTRKKNLPYKEFFTIPYNAETFDTDFYELYDTTFRDFTNYISNQIRDNTLISYFDNYFLHYSLIKEFYSNACQHAYEDPQGKKCFISLDSNAAIKNTESESIENLLESRYSEKPKEEQSFFKDREGKYINTPFIEFTFCDFGLGIASTLKSKYELENLPELIDKLSSNDNKQNIDTRVLEYAFLLFTSKYELNKHFSMHDYIPRGLFIIKDIVSRYNGMIVARSNKGKVIFNFSNNGLYPEVSFRDNDFSDEIGDGFPGTSITIVLPAKSKNTQATKLKLKVSRQEALIGNLQVIPLLQYITRINCSEEIIKQKNETGKRILFFGNFFEAISKDLQALVEKKGNLVLFDFAGVERSNQDIFDKFLYFLAYCPLISETLNVCLFNIVEKGINEALIFNENEKRKSKGFFAKPIPCIYPNLNIQWIGIDEPNLADQLTDLWQYDIDQHETIGDFHHLDGNVLRVDYKEQLNSTVFSFRIPTKNILLEKISSYHTEVIRNEIETGGIQFPELIDDSHNYNGVLNKVYDNNSGIQRAFLTSNGTYQSEFLTFIEKLYIREYRRLIATYFIFNIYHENITDLENIRQVSKILTVTLSSQLLGKEVTEILNELTEQNPPIALIPLSNYYDFNTEESFNDIIENDKIIVVNDVISSGTLSRKIIESVGERKASILSILTIVDSRTQQDLQIPIDAKITALCSRANQKYENNPFNSNPIWVNPILNAPTTMSRAKSNRDTILKTPQEFVNFFKDDDIFKVGHFKQNSRYLTYYLQTDVFFKKEHLNGFPVLSKIIEAFKDKIQKERDFQREQEYNALKNQYQDYVTEISESAFGSFAKFIENRLNQEQLLVKPTTIDFLFYPFLSSVSEIEKNLNPISYSLRGDQAIEIYPLPRIMTPKGWRFSFPPKFLNFHTKGKKALILDDGSCTGETIIQMIDTISFLELDEIFVLSLFGRLEDFQREFFSRIKHVSVKDKTTAYKTVPISIYFGTHFHIPIYTRITHPSFIELKELEEIENAYTLKGRSLPSHIQSYIEKRKTEISTPLNPKDSSLQQSIIPDEVIKRLMFIIRDILGNFDSYRLFKEDEIGFNDTTDSNQILRSFTDILMERSGKLALIGVLIQEPYLVDTIKRVYPDLLLDNNNTYNVVNFIKREISIIRSEDLLRFYLVGLSIIDHRSFFDFNFFFKLLNRVSVLDKTSHLLNFIGYFFSTILFRTKNIYTIQDYNVTKKLLQMTYYHINNNGYHVERYSSLIKELYNESLVVLEDFPDNENVKVLLNVQHYYQRQVSNHNGKISSSHPNYYTNFESIINRLGIYSDENPTPEDLVKLHSDLLSLVEKTQTRLLKDLRFVLKFLEPLYLNYDFEIDVPEFLKLLDQYKTLNKSLKDTNSFIADRLAKSNRPNLLFWLEKFNEKFFHLSNPLPCFFISNRTNLRQLIFKTITELSELKRKTELTIDIPNDIELAINPYLLRLIFFEIIENKFKHAPASNASINYQENYKDIRIIYRQHGEFEFRKYENGLTMIRNIVRHCSGKTESRSKPEYEFEIIFPKMIKYANI